MKHFFTVIVGCLAATALWSCDSSPEGSEAEGGNELSAILLEDDELSGQLSSANAIAGDEAKIKQEQARFLALAQRFEEKTGRKLSGVSLSGEQAALLETMLAKEEDITLRSLLDDILTTRKSISSLQDHIDELKAELPTPDTVDRGDTHMGLAVDFLTRTHGLDAKEAEALARRSLLTENLAPGMEVWHFYADGVYGTTVTQGTARVSPYFLNVRARRKIRQERDDALALAASLEAEITVLEATRDELRSDLRSLTADFEVLKDERNDLQDQRDDLVTSDESVWYYVDTRRKLREKDIIAPVGMRLKEWRKELFTERLDLRRQTRFSVYAEDFGVRRFRRIMLLPRNRYIEKEDYTVEYREDGQVGVVQLENLEKFKNDAFVVALK
ncbi:MAG: hypothetical protein CMP23_11895 [Rickettsiales bacterium]|nr:hypothetical protein [Rickettsiales bacterium]|tara:strand:- start:467 stop:1627 length:1161 start_codon:yes stop_codon:yes gene_type:complete